GIFFCKLEYENLYNGLQICLEKQETISIFLCLFDYFSLNHDFQSGLKLSEFVCQAQESYPSEICTGEIGWEIMMVLDRLANCYFQIKNYQKAKVSYQRIVELTQQLSGISEKQYQLALANTYHQLGYIAQELRDFPDARCYYQQSLEIYLKFGYDYDLTNTYHQNLANTYHQMGMVAQELKEFENAQQNYQLALNIRLKYRLRYEQAKTYHQLGLVALELEEFETARHNYQVALEIWSEFKSYYEEAKTSHELGIFSAKLGEFSEARKHYHKALAIKIEYNYYYEQAGTYGQLGLLAASQENYTEARVNLQKALGIYVEYKDEYRANITREILERLPE
ncbi:tetratricopeptide repeat protein, partial [Anabaena sp. UHCC 0253]|uniref:tetratricopeptide repeat protein n=1 Tax=Anabaena sp. UHCC 0253 TaxID=2590019 RepID=UPI0020C403E6